LTYAEAPEILAVPRTFVETPLESPLSALAAAERILPGGPSASSPTGEPAGTPGA